MELVSFVLAYFASKNLSLLTAFVCWPPEEILELWRCGGAAGVRVDIQADFHQMPALPAYATYREGILLDLTCPHADLVLQKASSTRAFNHRHSWLLVHQAPYHPTILEETLSDTAILPDADVTWSSPDHLVDVYRIKYNRPFVVTQLGLDRNSSVEELQALWRRLPTAVVRRKDLDNVIIEASSLVSQPQHFKGWSDLRDKQIDTFPKVTYPLLMLCTHDMNFRFNMRQVDLYGVESNGSFSGLAGLLQRGEVEVGVASMFMRSDRWRVLHFCSETVVLNGSFSGLAGLLQRGEVEVGVASMFMRSDRWRVLHFCSETVVLKGAFMFRQPSQSAVTNVFLLPFSRGVWCAVGAVLAAAGASLAALARPPPRPPRVAAHQALTLPDTFTFILGAICQQGFHLTPSVASVRVVMFLTLVSSLFVFTAYSAKIVALLQTPSDALQTIDQLAASPLHLGVQETTYKKVYFAESTDPATQRLYRRKLVPLGERAYLSVVDGIARMRSGLFAFQVEQSSAYDIISKTYEEHEKCGLKEIQAFSLPMVSVPIAKHSGYRELFAARLRWQRETGLVSKWRRVWMAARPRCDVASAGFISVGLGDVLPALQVLWMGALVAVLLLFLEIATHRVKTHSSRFKTKQNIA